MTAQDEPIKVEFSIREPILEPVEYLPARTLLINPFRQTEAIAAVGVPVLSCRETYCEKLRAALTRREPAIRDFYDIDHGVRSGRLDTDDRRVIDLVRSKLAVPGNDPIDISEAKHQVLKRQVQGQLAPSFAKRITRLSTWSEHSASWSNSPCRYGNTAPGSPGASAGKSVYTLKPFISWPVDRPP